MTRDATRPHKPEELLLWLRDRHPNDTDEELTKRFREHARDDLTIVDGLSDFFLELNFKRLLRPPPGVPGSIVGRKSRAAKAREFACEQMGGPTCRTAKSR